MSLLRARESVMSWFRPILAKYDVTDAQWRVIRVLGEESPLEANELAHRASVLGPSLTRIIKALSDRGLIARTKTAGDHRRIEVAITTKGRNLISEASPETNAVYAALKARLGEKRYEEVLDALDVVSDIRSIQPTR